MALFLETNDVFVTFRVQHIHDSCDEKLVADDDLLCPRRRVHARAGDDLTEGVAVTTRYQTRDPRGGEP